MADLTPAERTLRAQIAADESWARTPNRAARTAAARQARFAKYREQAAEMAGPGADDADIDQRAEYLMRADMRRMALKSAQARRQRKEAA